MLMPFDAGRCAMPNRPMVHFIGAGPGDPGLLTVRGARCLARADVVVYDELVHTALARYARPDAERISAGGASPLEADSDAIAYLLLEKYREGKRVARLKWGDPLVFDDGGEEALFLHEHGVPFEIVPGVPAAVGVPSYAGVPVTYRGGGDTLTLVRGHEDAGHATPRVDWASMAKLDGTIVCYAGPTQLPAMLRALRTHGRPADEPVAVIYNGTLASQHTITGTLAGLSESPWPEQTRPAIVVVGRVAALRDHLRWFDVRPLFGRCIVVTRPRELSGELVDLLEEQGAQVVPAPTVRLAEPSDAEPLDTACSEIGLFDWLVLPTLTGTDVFLRHLLAGPRDVRDLKGVWICAVGQSSVERFNALGVRVDVAPAEYRPESIVEALASGHGLKERRVLLPLAESTRDILAAELRRRGAVVTEVPAYRTVRVLPGDAGEPDLHKMLLEQQVDAVTFGNPSTVREFVELYGADVVADLLRTTVVACVGPVTAQALRGYGVEVQVVSTEHTNAGVVGALAERFRLASPRPD
jgi:uroporphyrinogen III methyltransferase / synthase